MIYPMIWNLTIDWTTKYEKKKKKNIQYPSESNDQASS